MKLKIGVWKLEVRHPRQTKLGGARTLSSRVGESEAELAEAETDFEAIVDWDGRIDAVARVLIAVANDEEPATVDLLDVGLDDHARLFTSD